MLDFIASVNEHAAVRGLAEDDRWWICAYSNNQHELAQDIDPDPRRTSFYLAMQQCEGVLLVLDDEATPFTRVWCCFEEAMIVVDGRRHKLDIATVVKGVGPQLLTEGLIAAEAAKEARFSGYGYRLKTKREQKFPLELLERAYELDITKASASVKKDFKRIINTINKVPADQIDIVDPDLTHHECDLVNRTLRSMFAETAVHIAGMNKGLSRAMPTISQHRERRALRIDLQSCKVVDVTEVVAEILKLQSLEQLTMDFSYCDLLCAIPEGMLVNPSCAFEPPCAVGVLSAQPKLHRWLHGSSDPQSGRLHQAHIAGR